MTRVDIKICGLSTPDTLDAALKGCASHIGFVHFEKSPRHVSVQQLVELSSKAPAHVKRVAVLVEPKDALVDELVAKGGLDVLQLHGDVPPARAWELKNRTKLEIWKAISVRTKYDLVGSRSYVEAADRVLFDAVPPVGSDLPGGNNVRVDWDMLLDFRPHLPWGLAGGLNPDNITQALRITRAPLVDVSSGVESAPGVKDVDKIAAFCKAVSAC